MKKAFVLGGTAPHIELIKKLKERGYYVYLIDYTPNPPAKHYADEHIMLSTLDKEVILQAAKESNIDLIISACIDQANSTACYVAGKMNHPIPYDYETSLNVTKKGLMKSIFKQHDIPTAEYYVVESKTDHELRLNLPVVVKPTDANSSKGVYRVDCWQDYREKIDIAISISRENKAIVEKFIPGTEIQVDCIAIDGISNILMTRDKISFQKDGVELQTAGFIIPGKVCEEIGNELKKIAQKVAEAFGLKNTPFFFQAICNDDGIFVLEFAPRIAGGTTYEMVKKHSGYDYVDSSIRSFLQERLETHYEKRKNVFYCVFLYMKPGVFKEVLGVKNDMVEYYFSFVNSGKIVDESMNSGNRIGAIVFKGNSYDVVLEKARIAMKMISITDENGNNVCLYKFR